MSTETSDPGFVVDTAAVAAQPLRAPFAQGGLFEVFRRRYLLRLLVNKEIQARYQGSVLGLLWSYVQPLVRFCLYYFVIGLVLGLHKDVPNFAIHMFCALVFVNYFTETFASGTRSILRNKALVRKMAMPREMFPVASMIVSAIHTFPQMVVLVIAAAVSGWTPSWEAGAAFLLGLALLACFATALALLFSALNVYFRDFENIVATLTIFTHWAVPMIYPWHKVSTSDIPTWGSELYLANPLAEAVLLMQRAFWLPLCETSASFDCAGPDVMPEGLWIRGGIMLVVGILFLGFAQWVFTRLEGKFAERI